jgi:hypothetical protein
MRVVIYSYIREWETDKSTKFYVVHSLSVKLNTNQTIWRSYAKGKTITN